MLQSDGLLSGLIQRSDCSAWISEGHSKGFEYTYKWYVSFELFVGVHMAPVVQILAFCVLPSATIVAASASFDTEMCFQNKVSGHLAPLYFMRILVMCSSACELVLVPGVSAVFSCYGCSW